MTQVAKFCVLATAFVTIASNDLIENQESNEGSDLANSEENFLDFPLPYAVKTKRKSHSKLKSHHKKEQNYDFSNETERYSTPIRRLYQHSN